MFGLHYRLEQSAIGFILVLIVVISIGGFIEIAPLFTIDETVEEDPDMRVYTPLELAGRNIYIREGCYACHSQMIRTLRDEVERYGPYSLAVESQYDHPMLWGSKRTGPDLARIGGKYSDDWHVAHLINPRGVVPESIMPAYPWLARTPVDSSNIEANMRAHLATGVPYTEEMLAEARADFRTQADPDTGDVDALLARYPKAQALNFDGAPGESELDAVIAYLQMLGTLVDFSTFEPDASR
jgi:cytochrome c oxidase cbb3-type subunit 2